MTIIRAFAEPTSLPDLQHYEIAFNEVKTLSVIQNLTADLRIRIEIGYRMLLKLSSLIYSDYSFFLILNGIITQVLLFIVLKRYAISPLLSLIIYDIMLFCPSVYILRQYLAILILMYGIRYIYETNWKRYLLICLIAVSVHNVSVTLLPFYFIVKQKTNKRYIFIITVSLILIVGLFRFIYFYFGETIFGTYGTYLYTDKYKGSNYTDCLIVLCFILVYVLFARKNILTNEIDKVLFTAGLFGFIIGIGGVGFPLIGRLALCYSSFLIFIIPRTAVYMKTPIRFSYICVVLILLYMAYFKDPNMYSFLLTF